MQFLVPLFFTSIIKSKMKRDIGMAHYGRQEKQEVAYVPHLYLLCLTIL